MNAKDMINHDDLELGLLAEFEEHHAFDLRNSTPDGGFISVGFWVPWDDVSGCCVGEPRPLTFKRLNDEKTSLCEKETMENHLNLSGESE